MRKLWRFHGGVHLPENKQQSNQTFIRPVSIPDTLTLPLSQHIGAAAEPIVSIGQQVKKGEMIADTVGMISVALHAPTSGTVIAIEKHAVPHPSGMTDTCIILQADGEDNWTDLSCCEDYKTLSPQEILERVRQAGIAGMGGAGFPTSVKLHPPKNDKVNALILNGAECEPYITADDLLMRERADAVVKGLEIMAYILEPEEALIGIEDNKPEAIAALRKAAANTQIEIIVVPTIYPSGGEKQLIKILTGLEVPNGHIPADIGVMCQNVATAAAVYEAIRYGKPLISRITTLTGEAIPRPGNYEVLIGTPVWYLLSQAGLGNGNGLNNVNNPPRKLKRLVMGGPMMGFTLPGTDQPVTKTTNCLLAATDSEFPDPQPEQPCIRCSLCAEACPAELLPQQLLWYSKAEEFSKAERHNLFDCIECGACSYVCPSKIPLVQYYRYAKNEVRVAQAEQEKSDLARERFEFRKSRLEREQQEKAAKRKARAEAAAKAQAARQKISEAESQRSDTDSADPQQVSIEAAVKRAQTKRQHAERQTKAEALPDQKARLKELQANVEKAQAKLSKVQASLTEAERDDNPMAEKLRNAVAKNKTRLTAATQALEDARIAAAD